jgi:NHLM bacteriocin system ABC transporter ATP-binding protein
MSWYDEQIRTRRNLDKRELEDAYARLASSITHGVPNLTLDNSAAADSAMGIVLSYYHVKPVNVPDSITDPMERVNWATRPTGIMRRAVRLEGEWWTDATGAYLATTLDNTPVALVPRSSHGYAYVDPTTHKKVRITRANATRFKPEALCFYRPLPQRELSIRDVGIFMMRSLDASDYMHMIASAIVSTLIGALPAVASRLLFARIIPSGMPSLILPIASLLVGMTLSQALIRVTTSVITQRLTTKLQVQMEAATYARVMLLPPTFFRQYAAGDLARRVSSMTQLVNTLSSYAFGVGLSGMLSLIYIAQILAYAPSLAVPALFTTILEMGASILVALHTMRYSRDEMEASAKLSGVTPSILHGIQKIKLAGAESRAFAHWARFYADVSEATYKRPALLLAGPKLIPIINAIGTVALYGIAVTSRVSIPNYMAFNTAFGAVSGAITAIASVATSVATMRPLLELIEPIMKAVPETLSNREQVDSITGSIEVSNLSFGYDEKGSLVINDLSMRIRAGEYVAIVGKTGCGKSTLMRLLLGFEKPMRGAIYYDGKDISEVDIRSLRRHIGVVLQSGSLFAGDLLMNITVASPNATLEDAWRAAEMAGIADDIRRMPMGMQTIVSEGGGGISGGQKQRILIARAVCGKPKMLMLDEATSALDNVTQRHVSDALEHLNCTRIVIAHRLSTIRHANRIIMLDGGKIAESGTYDDLMAANGVFAELVKRQQLEEE